MRPTLGRVREWIFSVIGEKVRGAEVLDLYAGIGSLGMEALSRGAKFVTFVEQDPKIIAILNKNIEKAAFVKESKVVRANAFKTGAAITSAEEKCALVFIDPPYSATRNVEAGSALSGLLDLLGEKVTAGGIVVVRTSQDVSLSEQYGQFRIAERRQWGTMAVSVLKKADE